jgi:hypothetical protein
MTPQLAKHCAEIKTNKDSTVTLTGMMFRFDKDYIAPELARMVREATEGREYDTGMVRAAIVRALEGDAFEAFRCRTPWPVRIIMPCGFEVQYDSYTIPTERVMCPCGDPNHILLDVVVEDGPLG